MLRCSTRTPALGFGFAAVGIAVLIGVFGGCASTAEPAPEPTLTWADQQRAQDEVWAQCARDIGGWSTEEVFADPSLPGGVTMNTGPMDTETSMIVGDAMRDAVLSCIDEFPPIAREQFPVTPAQAEAFYAALMSAGQCLRDLGYPISEPPSQQAIIAGATNHDPSIWDPWLEILMWQDPQHSSLRAAAECPQPNIWDFTG